MPPPNKPCMRNTENLKSATALIRVNTVLILSGTVQHMQRLVNTREILTLFLCLESDLRNDNLYSNVQQKRKHRNKVVVITVVMHFVVNVDMN